jgi:hypothetical protein
MKNKEPKPFVYCGYVIGPEYGADSHSFFQVVVDRPLMERVLTLARAVKELKVWATKEFDSRPLTVYDCPAKTAPQIKEIPLGDFDPETEDYEGTPEEQRCELVMLEVMDTQFQFTWVPKHGSRTEECCTELMDIVDTYRELYGTEALI